MGLRFLRVLGILRPWYVRNNYKFDCGSIAEGNSIAVIDMMTGKKS